MTTTTFSTKTFTPAAAPSVGDAFRQLMTALLATLPGSARAERPSTPADEANRVRELAYNYLNTDPGFAEDLFAAADRHELAQAEG